MLTHFTQEDAEKIIQNQDDICSVFQFQEKLSSLINTMPLEEKQYSIDATKDIHDSPAISSWVSDFLFPHFFCGKDSIHLIINNIEQEPLPFYQFIKFHIFLDFLKKLPYELVLLKNDTFYLNSMKQYFYENHTQNSLH